MAINYTTDIVNALFASNVETVTAYQAPGTFGLPVGYGSFTLDVSSAIAAAGTGYLVGDLASLSGGTHSVTAQIGVTKIGGSGAVTAFEVVAPGIYTVLPSNPVSTTGGSGSGLTLTAVWDGAADQRLLTFIELMRSYLAQIASAREQKLVQTIMRRMISEMRFGSNYSAATAATNAQAAALHYIAAKPTAIEGIL